MSKVALNNITGGYAAVDLLNENFDAIEAAFDNTLSRDGSTPNTWLANQDANHKRLLNLGDPIDDKDAVNKEYVINAVVDATPIAFSKAAYYVDRFTGDGSDTTFTLTTAPGLGTNSQVYINGAYQNKNTYAVSGTTLTFTEAPPLGSDIEVVVVQPVAAEVNAASNITIADASDYYTSGYVEGALQEVGSYLKDSTQNITGAVPRTLPAKLSDFVSVKDFGAVGDGVTDDTAAIQAALNSGATGIIQLTNSVISAALTPSSNQILRGGKLTAATGSWVNAIEIDGLSNVSIENVEITGNFDFGIRITDSSNITVKSCNIHDIGNTSPEYGFGILVGEYSSPGFSTNLKFVDNTIKNIGGNGGTRGDGIFLGYCSQVVVSNNYIDTVNRMGVAVVSAAHDISIVNNQIVNAALCGVDCEYDSPLPICYGIVIDGNTIANYARAGFTGVGTQLFAVDVHSNAHSVVVSNNVITPGTRATQVFHCQNGAYDIQFISNTVLNGGAVDLFLKTYAGGGTDKIVVANNTATFGNIDSFIDCFDGASITVTGNQFSGSSAASSFFIKLVDVQDLIVANNVCSFVENFAASGVGYCSSLVFSNNTSTTTGRGFDLNALTTGIEKLVITNNVIETPVGDEGINIALTSGYIRNLNLLNNVIPSATTKIFVSSAAFGWSVSTYNVRTDVAVPVAGQVIFELSTNKQIQYLSGAWVAPS